MKSIAVVALLAAGAILANRAFADDRVVVDFDKPAVKVSPLLYGIFFEEINRAGDGGLYAEMIQNRSFEDAKTPTNWRAVRANVALDTDKPINDRNPTSLRIECEANGSVANGGFVRDWHDRHEPGRIAVQQQKAYELSFYARTSNLKSLTASLQDANGKTLATKRITGVGEAWKKFEITLTPTETQAFCKLVISSEQAGTFWLDMVSLFPRETFQNRKNGLRRDLMEKLVAMKPAFVRFPGGCFVEGIGIENRVQWKNTIGDIAERPGHLNRNWGYCSTDGLGQHEYFLMCEDLGAEPVFVINCGMAHPDGPGPLYAVPMGEMGLYVQDALDAIEYANGPVTSTWGALRAKNGHPEPFHLKYVEIGNENWGPAYAERYALFHDVIKARYPEIQLIANEPVPDRKPDIIDPHHYGDYASFLNQVHRYDTYSRSDPKIYFGEYAQTVDAGRGTLQAAIGEAAFMTGLERNGDVVVMSSYAPLLCNVDWRAWNPNAIVFDQQLSYGTPSYYVQTMFAANRCDEVVPVSIDAGLAEPPPVKGKIGVGTWGGKAEFKDIVVVRGEKRVFESDFGKGTAGWELARGKWEVVDGALRQTGDENGTLALAGEADWTDITLALKARKIDGPEGFLISFGVRDAGDVVRWNLGGWGNREHGIEGSGFDTPHVSGSIDANRWYDVRVEVRGSSVKCYLDGQLVSDIDRKPLPSIACVAGRDLKTGDTILKLVNSGGEPRKLEVELRGRDPAKLTGSATILSAKSEREENSFDEPTRVAPRSEPVSVEAPKFTREYPAHSVTILRVK